MVAIVVMPGCDEIECGKSSMDSKLGFKQVLANHQFASLYIFQSPEGGGAKNQYNGRNEDTKRLILAGGKKKETKICEEKDLTWKILIL